MIEAFRTIGEDLRKSNLTKFAPVEELQRIIGNAPENDMGSYINSEFRGLLQRYGVDFDYPIGLRLIGRMFKKNLQRRAAVMIASDPLRARVLVIETDSRCNDIVPGNPKPHDANSADIIVWPMLMRKKKPSEKAWYVGGDEEPNPYKSRFMISIRKIGNSNFINTFISVPGYHFRNWQLVSNLNASDMLKEWSGLK